MLSFRDVLVEKAEASIRSFARKVMPKLKTAIAA
jgi:hypothetical protein